MLISIYLGGPLLQQVHSFSHNPWTICLKLLNKFSVPHLATLVIRLCLLPLVIDQRRRLAAYTNVMPKITSLQSRMTKARINSDYIESKF